MWSYILDLPIAILVLYFLYDAVTGYIAATGTVWERLLAAGKGSATIVWSRFVVMVSGLSGGLVVAADYLNAPGVASAVQSVIQPQYVMAFTVAIAVITEFARRRTL
jgi:hypothetical protein